MIAPFVVCLVLVAQYAVFYSCTYAFICVFLLFRFIYAVISFPFSRLEVIALNWQFLPIFAFCLLSWKVYKIDRNCLCANSAIKTRSTISSNSAIKISRYDRLPLNYDIVCLLNVSWIRSNRSTIFGIWVSCYVYVRRTRLT